VIEPSRNREKIGISYALASHAECRETENIFCRSCMRSDLLGRLIEPLDSIRLPDLNQRFLIQFALKMIKPLDSIHLLDLNQRFLIQFVWKMIEPL
jgi:hypothetical protein